LFIRCSAAGHGVACMAGRAGWPSWALLISPVLPWCIRLVPGAHWPALLCLVPVPVVLIATVASRAPFPATIYRWWPWVVLFYGWAGSALTAAARWQTAQMWA